MNGTTTTSGRPRTARRQGTQGPGAAPRARPRGPGVTTAARPGTVRPATMRPGMVPRHPAAPRAPFILLLLCLLGGGLICLLVINTTLGAASFKIDRLQQSVNQRNLQVQQLEQQVAQDGSPATIEQEACQLGMRPQQKLDYLDLRTHKIVVEQPAAPVQPGCSG